jgi:hypothetical protein
MKRGNLNAGALALKNLTARPVRTACLAVVVTIEAGKLLPHAA